MTPCLLIRVAGALAVVNTPAQQTILQSCCVPQYQESLNMTTSTLDLFSAFSALARHAPHWLGAPKAFDRQNPPGNPTFGVTTPAGGHVAHRSTVCRSLASAIAPRPLTPFGGVGQSSSLANGAAHPSCSVPPARPVRVLQVFEALPNAGINTRTAHIRISGRMADVCAELERLAASARMH